MAPLRRDNCRAHTHIPRDRMRPWTCLGLLVAHTSLTYAFCTSSTHDLRGRLPTQALLRKKNDKQEEPSIVEYNDFLPQPNPDLDATDVLHACMNTLLQNKDEGLEVCFHFSSDQCRAALGSSLDVFAQYATNPVFGFLVNCNDWQVVSTGPIIPGTPTRGAMQTILMEAKQGPEARRYLWTFQQERRPPRQGFWLIREVIYERNAHQLTV